MKKKDCYSTGEMAKMHLDCAGLTDQERIEFYESKKNECESCNKRMLDAIFVRLPSRTHAAEIMLAKPLRSDFIPIFLNKHPKRSEANAEEAWEIIKSSGCKTLADAIDFIASIDETIAEVLLKPIARKLSNKGHNAEKDTIH